MQNDLISRGALIEELKLKSENSLNDIEHMALNRAINTVKRQPTAYDVEKVTKKLNEFALNTEQYCVEHIANGICEDCESCNECVLRKAIEIVRNGGKE